jgi:hypothetical protein
MKHVNDNGKFLSRIGKSNILAVFLIAISVALISSEVSRDAFVPFVYANDTATVDVTVSASTLVDISPNITIFGTLGVNSTSATNTTTIVNIGSNPITSVYASVTNDAAGAGSGGYFGPFGQDAVSNYNAGNFLQIDNDTTGSDFFFVNKNEFNTEVPGYVTNATSQVAFFRIRVGGEGEYFASLRNTTTGGSGCHNGTLAISSVAFNQKNSGETDFSDGTPAFTQLVGTAAAEALPRADPGWGFADFTIGGNGYCVAVNNSCNELKLIKWNQGVPPYDTDNRCTNDMNLWSTTINPGGIHNINLRVAVPFGVSDGSVGQGTLTIHINS